jgi:hypothetical protein
MTDNNALYEDVNIDYVIDEFPYKFSKETFCGTLLEGHTVYIQFIKKGVYVVGIRNNDYVYAQECGSFGQCIAIIQRKAITPQEKIMFGRNILFDGKNECAIIYDG